MVTIRSFLLFWLGEIQYALDVAAVERVLPAAEVTPLPDAPVIVLGLINVAGELMPVINARRHFHHSPRDMELTDRLIVTRRDGRTLALLVDAVEGVVELSEQAVNRMVPGDPGSTSTVATLLGSIVLIPNIAALASAAAPGEKTGC
jgi:purine-binding chemotaxis protein CheW